ncbi:MAG: hypothetical protein K9G62_04080 [Alphaproteobacteria bacterium]|nr:hypothetical protein [Alphaproteobacteria bacterium]
MIRILGVRRVLLFLVLFCVNVALGVFVYAYTMPQLLKDEQGLRSLKGKISTLQTDIDRLQVEFGELENQKGIFKGLQDKGFFSAQGRRQAEKVLQTAQQQAGLISAVAEIGKGVVEDNGEAKKASHKILRSQITIKAQAIDDLDVINYLTVLESIFPGHVSVQRFHLMRRIDLTGEVLKSITAGENPALVEADIVLVWRTLIPASEIINPEEVRL